MKYLPTITFFILLAGLATAGPLKVSEVEILVPVCNSGTVYRTLNEALKANSVAVAAEESDGGFLTLHFWENFTTKSYRGSSTDLKIEGIVADVPLGKVEGILGLVEWIEPANTYEFRVSKNLLEKTSITVDGFDESVGMRHKRKFLLRNAIDPKETAKIGIPDGNCE